jgi:hypothetical protein
MGRDRGSVTMWMVGVIGLVTMVALALAANASAGVADGRAQAVADLAALAGVGGDRAEASAVAARNGASLLSYATNDDVVSVTVRRGGVRASAHATEGGDPG